jgi:hypothetical protein
VQVNVCQKFLELLLILKEAILYLFFEFLSSISAGEVEPGDESIVDVTLSLLVGKFSKVHQVVTLDKR